MPALTRRSLLWSAEPLAVDAELVTAGCPFYDCRTITERAVAEDKRKRGGPDRRKVEAGQAYEASYFASKHGIGLQQARRILARAGTDSVKANREAALLKKR